LATDQLNAGFIVQIFQGLKDGRTNLCKYLTGR
jgi:hypothetical protein